MRRKKNQDDPTEDVSGAVPAPGAASREAGHEDAVSLAARCVRALLDRNALPRHRHSAHIAGLLQLSYHQAHRRMTGGAPWSVEELVAVAAHHGETLVDLFGGQTSADVEPGVLIAGPLRTRCRIWPGPLVVQHRPGDLVAIKGGNEWVVMVAGDQPTPQACTVRRLVIESEPDRPRRFAILDDDVDVARGLAAGLVQLGYEAAAFATEAQLEVALKSSAFDAFVIDWLLGSGTAESLLVKLRSLNPSSPIALLTGKAGSKEVDEKAMVSAIEQHGLLFLQKPVTASIAASQFSAGFASR